MEESYTGLPTSHLLGSVPAVIADEKNTTNNAVLHAVPEANMQIFPPNNGGDRGRGYQTLESPTETFEQQPTNNWSGVFSISSYTQYFNVDTDLVLNRLISSMNPAAGDFFTKIDANPDLYGLIWISTTLVFVLAALGNLATYLMQKRTDKSTSWSFDVSYVNAAACSIYGYAIVVPLAYYFLLHYLGATSSLIRFWCMWGYSLAIFIPTSFLLLIPVEALRWIIILLVGAASASFVALNLKSYIEGSDVSVMTVAAFFLQIALAIFIKVWFFG
ncbi:protein YIPF1-like protein isoform X1 [Senna tora]|uniref:Protein YIP n=1 Tax=Senna tora TaxID=362788 RepID=A0A834T931_9FABA|nr:protein YIPF1-like protein isoform X1 [Senna tora]